MFYYYRIGDKKHGKVVPRSDVMESINWDPNYIRHSLQKKNKVAELNGHKYIQIPCNKCWACQLRYSAEWATRIMKEAEKYENNYFITLTYNDNTVPYADNTSWDQYDINPDDPQGEKIKTHQERKNDGTWGPTLYPKDMETFLNTLRKHFRSKPRNHEGIKYFYCGEYGSETQRPHYHIILMNCPLNPLEFYKPHIDKNFKAHWHSHELDHLWADDYIDENGKKHRIPKGLIDVAELEWSCAAYVARYCTKKLNMDNDKTKYLEEGRLPEFIRMSKGIGMDYLYEHLDSIYERDEIIMKTIKGNAGSIKPPKAYDRILKEKNPKLYAKIKKSREKAKERADEILHSITDMTDKMLLENNTRNIETKMSMLPRAGEW